MALANSRELPSNGLSKTSFPRCVPFLPSKGKWYPGNGGPT